VRDLVHNFVCFNAMGECIGSRSPMGDPVFLTALNHCLQSVCVGGGGGGGRGLLFLLPINPSFKICIAVLQFLCVKELFMKKATAKMIPFSKLAKITKSPNGASGFHHHDTVPEVDDDMV